MIKIKELINLNIPFILASKSPRRQKLLEQLGFEFEVIPSDIDENNLSDKIKPSVYVQKLANRKAADIAGKTGSSALVLGADTIVVLDGKVLHKPQDEEDAAAILQKLSSRTHTVYTGISLIRTDNGATLTDVRATDVTFRLLGQDEIKAYIATGSPMDKAGAYGIQDDFGAVFVKDIRGCYYNIVGLPLELLYTSMKKILK